MFVLFYDYQKGEAMETKVPVLEMETKVEPQETKGIGIRVTPSEIYYTVVTESESNDSSFVNEVLTVPKALDVPRQLSFIRTTLFSVICEHHITEAGLRTAEGSAQQANIFRLNLEGVIQELFSNSTITSYFTGTLTSMAARLGTTNTLLKQCCEGKTNSYNVEGWEKFNKNHRESYLAAISAIRSKK